MLNFLKLFDTFSEIIHEIEKIWCDFTQLFNSGVHVQKLKKEKVSMFLKKCSHKGIGWIRTFSPFTVPRFETGDITSSQIMLHYSEA